MVLKNRTFILGIISFILSIISISVLAFLFFGWNKNNYYTTTLIRFCLLIMFLSFVLGIVGIVKAIKGWVGKFLCIVPISIFSILIIIFLWGFVELTFPHKISKKKDMKRTSELLEIDLSDGKYLKRIESHSGFLGDGDYYAKIKFNDASAVVESIEKNSGWKKTPLPKSILHILYDEDDDDSISIINDKRMIFPKLEDGYYFFLNRSTKCEESENHNPDFIFDFKWSLNFTVALFDSNDNILYIYELDT